AAPGHPCLALQGFRGAQPRPCRIAKAARLAAEHPRIRRRAEERSLSAGAVFAEARTAPTRRSLRDPPLYPETRRHPRRHRSLEHSDHRPREALAIGLCWALGIR